MEAREAVNRVEDAEAKLNDLLEEIAAADARATSLARQREDAAARLQRLAQRAETLDAQGAELRAAGIDLARLEQADRELLEAEGTVEAAKARADEAEAAWRAAQVEEARIRDELQRAQEAHTRLAAEEDALGDLLSDGFDQSEFPSVLDSLSVEAGFEDALGAAFGDDLIAALSDEAPVHWHTSEWENGTGAAPALPAGGDPPFRPCRRPRGASAPPGPDRRRRGLDDRTAPARHSRPGPAPRDPRRRSLALGRIYRHAGLGHRGGDAPRAAQPARIRAGGGGRR